MCHQGKRALTYVAWCLPLAYSTSSFYWLENGQEAQPAVGRPCVGRPGWTEGRSLSRRLPPHNSGVLAGWLSKRHNSRPRPGTQQIARRSFSSIHVQRSMHTLFCAIRLCPLGLYFQFRGGSRAVFFQPSTRSGCHCRTLALGSPAVLCCRCRFLPNHQRGRQSPVFFPQRRGGSFHRLDYSRGYALPLLSRVACHTPPTAIGKKTS